MHNWGDVSMLAVALERLAAADHEVYVLTRAPAAVLDLLPTARPVTTGRPSAGWVERSGPMTVLRRTARRVVRALPLPIGRGRGRAELPRPVRDAVVSADLLVATGGGYLTTVFRDKLAWSLELFEAAREAGVPVALMGQGLGPFDDAGLEERLARVVRDAQLVTLRDPEASARWVESTGLARERVIVTGDDAVDVASRHGGSAGSAIGVNLRSTGYSGLGVRVERAVGASLRRLMSEHGADVHALPIASTASYTDVATIRRALDAAGVDSDGGAGIDRLGALLHETARCRVVVTGSYHAGVFALSQGIPIVALSASAYYDAKFRGLRSAFAVDGACRVVRFDDASSAAELDDALDGAWRDGPAVREALQAAAERQIGASRGAYRALLGAGAA